MADYKSTTNEGKCIFCEIIQGRIQTPGIFWEDDEFMAFLTTFPNTEGFTVVVPKDHYGSDVLAMEDDKLSRFVVAAKKVSNILKKHFDDVGRVGLIMEGTGIDHAHIKLFPMHGTEHLERGEWKQQHSGVDTFFETYKGYIASNDGPKADEKKLKDLAENLRKVEV
jgi:diadenosine tetraphosphate (Ap4A) HIT family hydrolase